MERRTWAAVAGAAVVLSGATVAAATAVTDTDTINACAHKRSGALRLASHCLPSERPVQWNVQGPPGPSDLAVTLRQRTRTFTVSPVTAGQGPAGVSSACEPGETVLSGGLTGLGADLFPLELFNSGPFFDGSRSGWNMEWINRTDEPVTATVTMSALCTVGSMTSSP